MIHGWIEHGGEAVVRFDRSTMFFKGGPATLAASEPGRSLELVALEEKLSRNQAQQDDQLQEIEVLKSMGVKQVYIEDDTIFGKKRRAIRLAAPPQTTDLSVLCPCPYLTDTQRRFSYTEPLPLPH